MVIVFYTVNPSRAAVRIGPKHIIYIILLYHKLARSPRFCARIRIITRFDLYLRVPVYIMYGGGGVTPYYLSSVRFLAAVKYVLGALLFPFNGCAVFHVPDSARENIFNKTVCCPRYARRVFPIDVYAPSIIFHAKLPNNSSLCGAHAVHTLSACPRCCAFCTLSTLFN